MNCIKDYIEDRDELCTRLADCCIVLGKEASNNPRVKSACNSISFIIDSISGNRMFPRTVERGLNRIDICEQLSGNIASHSKNSDASLNRLQKLIFQLRQVTNSESIHIKGFNTDEYYKEEKDKLEKKLNELREELARYISDPDAKLARPSEATGKLQAQISEVTQMIEQLDKESQSAKQRNDAVAQLSDQINNVFSDFAQSNTAITKEQKRLTRLYWIYFWGICIVLGLLSADVICFLCNWSSEKNLYSYIPFYLPVSLCVGLLWAFIYQMNRAQRQLVLIAYNLHRIEYVKQLMLGIIKLTPDVIEGTTKACHIMDNIIHEYVHINKDETNANSFKVPDDNTLDLRTLIGHIKELRDLLK